MKLKNITITPKALVLSEEIQALLKKFSDANSADSSHYYQSNVKANNVCSTIETLSRLRSMVQSEVSKGDPVRSELYQGIKDRARELLGECDSEENAAHLDLPTKTQVLEGIAGEIAEAMTKFFAGLYLCIKKTRDHSVYILHVARVRCSLCSRGYSSDENQRYYINFKIAGNGTYRTDEGESFRSADPALSFGRFTYETDSIGPELGIVTPKQFQNYIEKAVQEMHDICGLTSANDTHNGELNNAIRQSSGND